MRTVNDGFKSTLFFDEHVPQPRLPTETLPESFLIIQYTFIIVHGRFLRAFFHASSKHEIAVVTSALSDALLVRLELTVGTFASRRAFSIHLATVFAGPEL